MVCKHTYPLFLFISTLLVSCIGKTSENLAIIPLHEQITAVKMQYAPDKRVALFEVDAIKNNDKYILTGESDLAEAVTALKDRLTLEKIAFVDSIKVLPSNTLEEKSMGLVTISVANLRSKPAHAAELATQATLGTPVKILKNEGDWSFIQTPDKYLAWVDAGGITALSRSEMAQWKLAPKVIYTATIGQSYSQPNLSSQVVSDMVAGAVLERIGEQRDFFEVKYPDGRHAFLAKSEAKDFDGWLLMMHPSEGTLVDTAKKLMGLPYLWGGTSTKGVDCSGYTKTIFFLNGMVIPRDASQQVNTGKPIDSTQHFENLEKGDLLFFGRKATDSTSEKVVHVGMWIGNNEFIHSSGRVRVGSLDPKADNFDAYNLGRYLRSNRLLKETDSGLLDLAKATVFKD